MRRAQRLSLVELALGLEQRAEACDRRERRRVRGAKALLVVREHAPEQRLRLRQPPARLRGTTERVP